MSSRSSSVSSAPATARLRAQLSLWDLIFYGLVIITPIAPAPIYGVVQVLSRGHVSTAVLLAGIAMMFTAFSYGRMAVLYPSTGSAYTYVARGLHRYLGMATGWAMLLDYLLLPVIAVIQAALASERLAPQIPYVCWVAAYALLITAVNLRGIRTTAGANKGLLAAMSVVIVLFLVLAIRFVVKEHGAAGLVSLRPFYSPGTFQIGAVATATSLAALTYIGFDGVTTLAEEVRNPTRTVPLATVGVCAGTTILSLVLVYLAQLVWMDYRTAPSAETAFLDVTHRAGGQLLFQGMGIVIALASLGGGLSGQAAAARVLYALGRDNVLPARWFGVLEAGSGNPKRNILAVGALALSGALFLHLEQVAELLNFGAFLAFMGVNLAAIRQFGRVVKLKAFASAAVSGLGFLFCLAIWLSLPGLAKTVGFVWFLAGLAIVAFRTRGFRNPAVEFNLGDS